jgi:RNA polymerase sigma-70 factor (ECF subfamily)
MLQDQLLVWRLKHGDGEALRQIYEKYKVDLLALAGALLNDKAAAEDVVHDVFVSFAQFAAKLQLRTNLKGYLLTSVANHVRNLQTRERRTTPFCEFVVADGTCDWPDGFAISIEESRRIDIAMLELPYEQREVITLHVLSGLKFAAIAKSQGVSINTVQSRYRYGLNKLRSILNGEVER